MNQKIKHNDKLYIVTRADMPAGYQGVQSIHAAQEFAARFPITYQTWHETSNYLGFLAVRNEAELKRLAVKAMKLGLAVAVFTEPDVNYQVTAIAIQPGSKSKALVKGVPLALKYYVKKRKRA